MRVEITESEWYPVYWYDPDYMSHGGPPTFRYSICDLPPDKKEWVDRVMTEFEEVQSYLYDLHTKHFVEGTHDGIKK